MIEIITKPFTKGYCSVTAIDSIVITLVVLTVFFTCHFIWFAISEMRKGEK